MLSGDGGGGQRDLPSIYPFLMMQFRFNREKLCRGKLLSLLVLLLVLLPTSKTCTAEVLTLTVKLKFDGKFN